MPWIEISPDFPDVYGQLHTGQWDPLYAIVSRVISGRGTVQWGTDMYPPRQSNLDVADGGMWIEASEDEIERIREETDRIIDGIYDDQLEVGRQGDQERDEYDTWHFCAADMVISLDAIGPKRRSLRDLDRSGSRSFDLMAVIAREEDRLAGRRRTSQEAPRRQAPSTSRQSTRRPQRPAARSRTPMRLPGRTVPGGRMRLGSRNDAPRWVGELDAEPWRAPDYSRPENGYAVWWGVSDNPRKAEQFMVVERQDTWLGPGEDYKVTEYGYIGWLDEENTGQATDTWSSLQVTVTEEDWTDAEEYLGHNLPRTVEWAAALGSAMIAWRPHGQDTLMGDALRQQIPDVFRRRLSLRDLTRR